MSDIVVTGVVVANDVDVVGLPNYLIIGDGNRLMNEMEGYIDK